MEAKSQAAGQEERAKMADEDKKKSFWEILAIVITAIAAVLGGLNGVAALITAMNGSKEGATKTESVPPTQAAPATQPSSVNDAAQRAAAEVKAEAEAAKARAAALERQLAETEAAKVEAAEAKARAAELEKKLAAVADEKTIKLETDEQHFSYALGIDFGTYLKGLREEFDLNIIEQAMKDVYTPGSKPLMTAEEAAKVWENFGKRQQEKLTAKKLPAAADEKPIKLEMVSYALGMDFGSYLKGIGEKFDLAIIQQGTIDAYTPGSKPLMTTEQVAKAQENFGKRQQQKFMTMLQANKEAAKKFLDENKSKEGVKTTASGLQYKVLRKGDGPKPNETDTIKVHYRGTLLDGTEFDSSYKRNEPAKFRLNQVIPGWIEALQLMPVGSIFELYLSPDLAYGDKGAPPVIQPGSLLKFEVELLDIVGE